MSLKTCSVSVLLMVMTMVGFFFQDLVLVHVEISQVKQFDTFMNCYRDDSRPYVSSITQFSVCFPLKLYIFICLWGGYTVFTLSVRPSFRPSVTFWFFFNILKRQ